MNIFELLALLAVPAVLITFLPLIFHRRKKRPETLPQAELILDIRAKHRAALRRKRE